MSFLEYEPLGFSEGGKSSAPLFGVDQFVVPYPSLCLCPWREAGGVFKVMSRLGW